MKLYYKPYLKENSRNLRSNMTKTEVILWNRIRKRQLNNLQFYRQKPLGSYIVDFYCPVKKMVIEIDGGQHYEKGKIVEADKEREDFLKNILGLKIIRFTNIDIITNLNSAVDKIMLELK